MTSFESKMQGHLRSRMSDGVFRIPCRLACGGIWKLFSFKPDFFEKFRQLFDRVEWITINDGAIVGVSLLWEVGCDQLAKASQVVIMLLRCDPALCRKRNDDFNAACGSFYGGVPRRLTPQQEKRAGTKAENQ